MMRELSIFVDESGDRNANSRYYLLTLVFHEQAEDIKQCISQYESRLLFSDLPNIPFHSEPLLNGHGQYRYLDIHQRKRILTCFAALVRRLPVSYVTFRYRSKDIVDDEQLETRMKRDITEFLREHLDYFQSFNVIKVYYDNGQDVVSQSLDQAILAMLSKHTVQRRKTSMTDYRLEQVADYLCTIELAAIKYGAKENGGTYNKFFGGIGKFKKNWLKKIRPKKI
ncbi:MAG: DUF3800 domain-containing protein [Varibaculum timonense]